MSFSLKLATSLANEARKSATSNTEVREIETDPDPDEDTEENKNFFAELFGNIVSFVGGVFKGVVKFLGFILGGIITLIKGPFQWTYSTIAGWIIGVGEFLVNFDWNITDETIDANLKGIKNNIIGTAGSTVGNALGNTSCGVLPGMTLVVVNEEMARYVNAAVREEVADEIMANLAQMVQVSVTGLTSAAFQYFYKKKGRRFVQQFLTENPIGEEIGDFLGYDPKKPFIISEAIEEKLESIPNEDLRNFVTNAYEEFWDGCKESFYVLANAMDSYRVEQQALAKGESQYYYQLTLEGA